MRDAVICEPLRTPVGGFGGTLRDVPAQELAATVIRALMERTGLPPESVEDVILGHCYPTMDAPAIGRVAALDAGLPVTASGIQLDRRCGSGLQAVLYAAMQVQTGASDLLLAGGAESMSNAPFYSTAMRWGVKAGPGVLLQDGLARGRVTAGGMNFPVPGGMIETAENLSERHQISRQEQDAYALRSHQRAVAAVESGKFAEEIVPVLVPQRRGEPIRFQTDEGPRKDTSLEVLARLRPITSGGTVTAGNASAQNDAASVCLVVAGDQLDALGLKPMAFLRGWAVAGVHPAYMGIGPVPAVEKAFARTGLTWGDIDLIELNEAFAAQVLAVLKEWKLDDWDKLNVNGSGISLGHPIAATGARILTTLLHEMQRRDARYGLETMCVGGGQGVAAIFERR